MAKKGDYEWQFILNIKDEKVKSFISILWVVSYVLLLICKIINLKEIKLDKYMKKSIFQIILLVILLLCYLIESVSYFQNRKIFFSKLRSFLNYLCPVLNIIIDILDF